MLPHFWGTPHCYGSSLLGAWQNAGDAQLSEHLAEHVEQCFGQFRAVLPNFHLLPPGEALGGKMGWGGA